MEEQPNKSEQELLKEEFSRISGELGEVITQKTEIEERMKETDYTSLPPEDINKMEEEYTQVRSRFIELTNKQGEISNKLVKLKNK